MLRNQPFHLKGSRYPEHVFILLHGLGGGIYEMSLLAKALHEAGYTVIGFNYPGHDEPARRMPASTWQEWYGRVESVYLDLIDDPALDGGQTDGNKTKVSVIGFSTGCLLGLHLAAQYPLHRLILLSPFLKIRHEWYYFARPEAYVRSVGRVIRSIPRRRLPITDPEMLQHAHNACFFKTLSIDAVQSALDLIELVDGELELVTTPTLIVQSHRDTIVCPSGAEVLMERLASEQKRLYWLAESDHVIPLDVERDAVMAQIRDFMRE